MRRAAAAIIVSLIVLFGQRPTAQGLTFSLFERYLESLRVQAGIPGMSALILKDGAIAWERGFGRADIDRNLEPTSFTGYQLGGLSQTMGAALLLKKCVDQRGATLNDPVNIWSPFVEPTTTLAQLLAHVTPAGAFKYDLARFSALTGVIESCSVMPYQQLLAEEIFSWLSLEDSVPGTALSAPTTDDVKQFGINNLARYATLLSRVAKGYRVDTRGRVTRTDVPLSRVNAATGVVSTARDLARFDAAFRYNTFVSPQSVAVAWSPLGIGFPAGLGWFVQSYNGNPVVWQFGVVPDAYSALLVKLPTRGTTLILLANSDALGAQGVLEKGDVTASVFARVFLRTYVP